MNEAPRPIRVMIVEDEKVVRLLLEHIIENDPRLTVAASVESGEQALAILAKVRPDVISLDIRLPGMNGFEVTRAIMRENPTPIVVVSGSIEADDLKISMNALRAGALSVVEKPVGVTNTAYGTLADRLCRHLVMMSDVRLVRQRGYAPARQAPPMRPAVRQGVSAHKPNRGQSYRLLGIVASTGGPNAVVEILKALSPRYPLPIVLVQHITPSFLGGFASWLSETTGFATRIVQEPEVMSQGVVYLAPGDSHLEVCGDAVRRNALPKISGQRPSGTVLLQSVAGTVGPRAIGVVLTGMGDDGAEGLFAMRQVGGYTIAESPETTVVYGMPKAAVAMGAVCEQLPLQHIGPRLRELAAIERLVT